MTLWHFAIVAVIVSVLYLWRDVRILNKRVRDELAALREERERPTVASNDPRDVAAAVVDRHVQEFHRR